MTHDMAGAVENGQPALADTSVGTSKASSERALVDQIVALANPDFHGVRYFDTGKQKWRYHHEVGPLPTAQAARHVADKVHFSVAVNLELERDGEKVVRAVCFDIDDHGARYGSRALDVASRIEAWLRHNGFQPLVVKSGGGVGYHVWMFFDRDLRKDQARALMTSLLKKLGLAEGTKGVGGGEVECFPKAEAKSLVALPFGRRSCLMVANDDCGLLLAQEIPSQLPISTKRKPGPKAGTKEHGDAPVDLQAAFNAFVQGFDGGDYDAWVRVLAIVKAALGEEGWLLVLAWSAQFEGYQGEADVRQKWDREIGTPKAPPEAFWAGARKNGYEGGLPPDIRLEKKSKKAAQGDVLLDMVRDMRTVMSREGAVFVLLGLRHYEEVGSPAVKRHLTREFFKRTRAMASAEQIKSAQSFLDAKETETDEIFIRCARRGGRVFYAVEDEAHTVLEIGPRGVTECGDPPVKFRRGDCLPAPVDREGTLEDFKSAIPADDDNLVLLAAVLVKGLLEPDTGHPICLFHGPANSAKSATMRTAVAAIDPKAGICAAPPKNEGDLIAAAASTYFVTFDNVSSLAGMSDAFCRLATGGGLKKRQLYTDNASFTVDVMRPLFMTAIDPEIAAQDLITRLVKIELTPMCPEERLTDGEVNAMRERLLPRVRRYLLDLAAQVLASEPVDARHPDIRMGSFANVGERVARILGRKPGWFVETYAQMIADCSIEEAESDLVVRCIRRIVANSPQSYVRTNCEMLLGEMREEVVSGGVSADLRDLPKNPRALASRIRKAVPVLQRLEYDVQQEGSRREWVFTRTPVPDDD